MRRRIRVIVQILGPEPLNAMESETPVAESREYSHLQIPDRIDLDNWCDRVAASVKQAIERFPSW